MRTTLASICTLYYFAFSARARLRNRGLVGTAVLIKSFGLRLLDHLRRTSFKIAPLEHPDKLAVLQKADRRRRRCVSGKVVPGGLGGIYVGTGENGDRAFGFCLRRLQGHH